MPKRIVDGEGLWRSDKLARVEPPGWRAEYANLLPLALANGTFELNARRIWAGVYSFNRPDVSVDDVSGILDELERVGMLFRWADRSTGKAWGYWVGSHKPGRLPGKSRRGKNEVVGPEPPRDELRKFLESHGIHEAPDGSKSLLGSGSGFGSGTGSGFGSGTGSGSEGVGDDSEKSNQTTNEDIVESLAEKFIETLDLPANGLMTSCVMTAIKKEAERQNLGLVDACSALLKRAALFKNTMSTDRGWYIWLGEISSGKWKRLGGKSASEVSTPKTQETDSGSHSRPEHNYPEVRADTKARVGPTGQR